MDIALIVVTTALAAITAFMGVRSHDTQRFTKLGWVAVFLSIVALVGNVYQAYAKRRESEQLLAAIAKESFRLSPQDFQLWLRIEAPGYEPDVPATASERHRLEGKLDGKSFSTVIEPALAPSRVLAGRGSHGADVYRFVSVWFYFYELGGELFLKDLQDKYMEIGCDPKALGFLAQGARCNINLFVKGRHFQAKYSDTDSRTKNMIVSFGSF